MSTWTRLVQTPEAQDLVAEYLDLQTRGPPRISTAGGSDVWSAAISNLFSVLRRLMRDDIQQQQMCQWPDEAADAATDDTGEARLVRILAALDAGERVCMENVTLALSAAYLLRNRLRELDVRDSATFVTEADRFLLLIAPEISVRELYQRNQAACAQLWEALGRLLLVLREECCGQDEEEAD